jgi:hypothetical protein
VSATDPAQRTVLPIPPTSATYKKSTKPVFIEYKSSHFVPGKMPLAPKRGGQLAASYHERKNREEMRKRIVDGFDFDSDESGDASPEEGPTESEAMNQEMTKSTSTGRDQQAEAASGRRKRTASKSSDGDPVESITDVNGEVSVALILQETCIADTLISAARACIRTTKEEEEATSLGREAR